MSGASCSSLCGWAERNVLVICCEHCIACISSLKRLVQDRENVHTLEHRVDDETFGGDSC